MYVNNHDCTYGINRSYRTQVSIILYYIDDLIIISPTEKEKNISFQTRSKQQRNYPETKAVTEEQQTNTYLDLQTTPKLPLCWEGTKS